jgi:UDP-2,4-diacetamido-2,4,6-trideoxy-beta-L-altropyranose hydrolase
MKVIFRCDATVDTGLGHLSRSLALAEAMRRRGLKALFVGHWSDPAVTLLKGAGVSCSSVKTRTGSEADAESLAALVGAEDAVGIVADSYAIDSAWIERLASRDVSVVLIDDFARLADYSACAGVLNFTVGAFRLTYPGLNSGQLALGPEHFPAREKLVELRRRTKQSPAGPFKRVLIALGGGDPLKMTAPIYQALHRFGRGLEVRALVSNGAEIARRANVNPADFPALAGDLSQHYAWADCCVSGGGLTKYECAYLGLPVAIYSQTPEQQSETDLFCATGVGWDLASSTANTNWESRLEAFVRGGHAAASFGEPSRRFPADSVDHAAAKLVRFLTAVPKSIAA